MASKKKVPYVRTKQAHLRLPLGEQMELRCFLQDLLDGTILAANVTVVRDGRGRIVRLDYDEP